ncbi:tRNA preQ1(34) S-adenosylmethionine ribosyltransferase-isomerase QueA [Proteocatella sphenisci]|uniref:tRNA preQ1(34) S-adenosylmethionine ribosyltransferase-isomerase QueA n=1 Tax=Proteocatella sphenisci TaxID=181070 RepID=UPI00048A9C2D|nr:tRNA preQ1(34) S-adenosylmethionine ribosyltransferase-isomerase QueA [Proteocatella sphenisci]
MNTKDFYYDLPQERIAQTPLKDRSKSKLMDFDKNTGSVSHRIFEDIVNDFGENDLLVLNNTRVLPARMYGIKEETGAKIEILLTKRIALKTWEVMAKPAKRLRHGAKVKFSDELSARVTEELEEGMRILEFEYEGVFEEIIEKIGTMPLPPYIKEKLTDQERYQTVYSKIKGSSAAPTAGLHFTEEILDILEKKGVQIEYVTLHVGLGTFKTVSVEDVENHVMHSEYYKIDEETANRINLAKAKGKKITCVGTTSVRTIESAAVDGKLKNLEGETQIFIYPPYKFKMVDALVTNFHLPESTLIMLISAFSDREKILNAYDTAVEEKYRFFSFGDAMYIH